MDERMKAAWLSCALAGGFFACAGALGAQELADPTRPPEFRGSQEASPLEQGGRLQSVLLSSGRKIAVIDGATVPLGGRLGGATLVSIMPTHVVLREGDEERVLRLHPGIEKKTTRGKQ
jgi:MSHA biogenesis protein MshK